MPDAIEQAITNAAAAPSKASNSAGSVEQHNLKDLIEVDQYLEQKAAARRKLGGIRFVKIVSPGAI